MSHYQFIVQNRNGTPIADITDLLDRKYSLYLNRASEASGTLPATSSQARRDYIEPGTKELVIYRDGIPIETVFTLDSINVKSDENEQFIDIGFHGILNYLSDALIIATNTTFVGSKLPWSWINTFQTRTGASYGITEGIQNGTPTSRTRNIDQDATLLDEIISLSESSPGFDFAINTNRQYVEWHTQRGTTSNIVLTYGGNVKSFDYTESTEPGEIVTDIRAYGPPNSGAARTASDTNSRLLYGRREASITFNSENENATINNKQLQAFADAALDRIKPTIIPSVEITENNPLVNIDTISLGDTIRFQAEIGNYLKIEDDYRIIAIHVALDDDDNEQIKLDLNIA